mmetsp:Transcript_30222/g.32938  ORF Transcript_30222/g.32938 Transcript_30222/m.32938 type:complete len:99 (-) Transcript_30222:2002-2298(-)
MMRSAEIENLPNFTKKTNLGGLFSSPNFQSGKILQKLKISPRIREHRLKIRVVELEERERFRTSSVTTTRHGTRRRITIIITRNNSQINSSIIRLDLI